MKRLFLSILMAVGIVGSAQALDSCFTGSWYDPTTSDSVGLDFQVLPNARAAGYFYTWYGEERELFLVVSENSEAEVVTLSGYQSLYAGAPYVGFATFTAIDNDHIVFTYDWIHDHRNTGNTMRWCTANCSGTYEFTRLTQPVACED